MLSRTTVAIVAFFALGLACRRDASVQGDTEKATPPRMETAPDGSRRGAIAEQHQSPQNGASEAGASAPPVQDPNAPPSTLPIVAGQKSGPWKLSILKVACQRAPIGMARIFFGKAPRGKPPLLKAKSGQFLIVDVRSEMSGDDALDADRVTIRTTGSDGEIPATALGLVQKDGKTLWLVGMLLGQRERNPVVKNTYQLAFDTKPTSRGTLAFKVSTGAFSAEIPGAEPCR